MPPDACSIGPKARRRAIPSSSATLTPTSWRTSFVSCGSTSTSREHFNVGDNRVRLACNLFADHVDRQHEIEDFWLSRLGLERESLRASTVNTYSKYSQKKRSNKLPYGTSALIVHSTHIAQTIYGSIQELGGFERNDRLD
jgi:hypothetical protein